MEDIPSKQTHNYRDRKRYTEQTPPIGNGRRSYKNSPIENLNTAVPNAAAFHSAPTPRASPRTPRDGRPMLSPNSPRVSRSPRGHILASELEVDEQSDITESTNNFSRSDERPYRGYNSHDDHYESNKNNGKSSTPRSTPSAQRANSRERGTPRGRTPSGDRTPSKDRTSSTTRTSSVERTFSRDRTPSRDRKLNDDDHRDDGHRHDYSTSSSVPRRSREMMNNGTDSSREQLIPKISSSPAHHRVDRSGRNSTSEAFREHRGSSDRLNMLDSNKHKPEYGSSTYGSSTVDDDGITCFTEQKAARRAREELEGLLLGSDGGGSIRTSRLQSVRDDLDDDGDSVCGSVKSSRSMRSTRSAMSVPSIPTKYWRRKNPATPVTRSIPENNDRVEYGMSSHKVMYTPEDDGATMGAHSAKSMGSQTAFELEVSRFKKKLNSEDDVNGRTEQTSEYESARSEKSKIESLKREFETVVSNLKSENDTLVRQEKHVKRKNLSLTEKLDDAQDEIQELKKALKAKELESQDRRSQRNDESALVRDLRTRLVQAEGKSSRHSGITGRDADEKINKLEEKLFDSHATITTLERALAKKSQIVASLRSSSAPSSVTSQNEEAVQNLRKLLEEAQLNNESLSEDITHYRDKLSEAETKAARVPALQALLEESESVSSYEDKKKAQESENVLSQLQGQKQELEETLSDMSAAVSHLEMEKQQAEGDFSEMSEGLRKITAQLQTAIEKLQTENGSLSIDTSFDANDASETTKCFKLIEILEKEILDGSLCRSDLKAQLEQYETELRNSQEKERLANQNNKDNDDRKSALQDKMRAEIEYLKLDKADVEIQLQEKSNEIVTLETELASKENALVSLRMEVNELERKTKGGMKNEELESDQSKIIDRLRKEISGCKLINKALEENMIILRNELSENDATRKSVDNSSMADRVDRQSYEILQRQLRDAVRQRDDLEETVREQEKLLARAESVMAKTNAATLSALMGAVNPTKS